MKDDRWFAYVCALDPADDPLVDRHCWIKANPNLGVTIQNDYLEQEVAKAKHIPAETNTVLRLNFCIWTHAQSRFLDMQRWHLCQPFPTADELVGARCYAGLDLGQSDDLCAFVVIWVLTDGRVAVKARFWLPAAALETYPNRPYDEWQRDGNLEVTEGDITDYGQVEKAVGDDCRTYGVLECAYDKRFANQMAQNLQGLGITMVDTLQGFGLNEALRKLSDLVVSTDLCHGQNPVLTVMGANAVVRHGRNKEIRLDKEKSSEKIDGIAALSMAINCLVARIPELPSKYEDHDMAAV